MHITSNEIQLIPSVVAALAIIGGYFGVRSANLNARILASEQYLQKRRTKAYMKLLTGLHYYASRLVSLTDPYPGQVRSIKPPDSTYEEEAAFTAAIYPYVSHEIYQQWVKFVSLATSLTDSIEKIKQDSPGISFTQSTIHEIPALAPQLSSYEQAQVQLIELVRSQIGSSTNQRQSS